MYCQQSLIQQQVPEDAKHQLIIVAPVSGQRLALSDVGDPLIAARMWGDGCALTTSSSVVKAPLTGTVEWINPAGYELRLKAKNGLRLWIKLGIGTQHLMGERCFYQKRQNDKVSTGDVLFEINPGWLKQQGISPVCIVTIINAHKLKAIVVPSTRHCQATEDTLMTACL